MSNQETNQSKVNSIKNLTFLGAYKRYLRHIKDKLNIGFNIDAIDVYLISYPNSGRTWFRLLIGKALCEKYGLNDELMLDTKSLTETAGILRTTFTHDCSLVDNNSYKYFYTKELFFNKARYRDKKIILLVRDPRDVMVSYYFQQTKRDNNYQGNISDFIRSDKFGISKLLRFNRIWIDNQKFFNSFLILSYEQAYANTIDSLRKTLEFMDVRELDSKILESAVNFSEFKNMNKLEKSGYFSGYKGAQQMIPRKYDDKDSFKTRKGKIGGYVDHLTINDIEYINEKILQSNLSIYQDLSF